MSAAPLLPDCRSSSKPKVNKCHEQRSELLDRDRYKPRRSVGRSASLHQDDGADRRPDARHGVLGAGLCQWRVGLERLERADDRNGCLVPAVLQ